MSEKEHEKMLELLSGKAFANLSESERAELAELEKLFPELQSDESFELAAAAASLTNLDVSEPLPAHLQARILADADKYFAGQEAFASDANNTAEQETRENEDEIQKTFVFEPKRSYFWQWLGWAVAGAACLALAINFWTTRFEPQQQIVKTQPPATPSQTPQLSPAEAREQFLASTKDVIQTPWTNPQKPDQVLGDIVWSNSQQKGFLRFRGLPANDPNRESYQLWIVDKNQKHPIDGGVFDVTRNEEVVIPIDAKLKVKEPVQFAVTAEKPGGVPVSDLGKVMAVAKIET